MAETAHEDANIIWGVSLDENMDDEIKMTVIATGFAGGKKGKSTSGAELLDAITNANSSDDEDDYTDLMSIFNKN